MTISTIPPPRRGSTSLQLVKALVTPGQWKKRRDQTLADQEERWRQAPPHVRSELTSEILQSQAAVRYHDRLQGLIADLKVSKPVRQLAAKVVESAPEVLVRLDAAFANILASDDFRFEACMAIASTLEADIPSAPARIADPRAEISQRQLGAPIQDDVLKDLLPPTCAISVQQLRHLLVHFKVLDRDGNIHGRLLGPRHFGLLRDGGGNTLPNPDDKARFQALGLGEHVRQVLLHEGIDPNSLLIALFYAQELWQHHAPEDVLRQRLASDDARRCQLLDALRQTSEYVDPSHSTHLLQAQWNQYLQESLATIHGTLLTRLLPVGGAQLDALIQSLSSGSEPILIHALTHALEQHMLKAIAEGVKAFCPSRQAFLERWSQPFGIDLGQVFAELDQAVCTTRQASLSPTEIRMLNELLQPLGVYAEQQDNQIRFGKLSSWSRWATAAVSVGQLLASQGLPAVFHSVRTRFTVQSTPPRLLNFLCLSAPRAMIACFIAGENGGIVPHHVFEARAETTGECLKQAARLINGDTDEPTFRIESCDQGYRLAVNPGQENRAKQTLNAAHQRLVAGLKGPHARLFGSTLERDLYLALADDSEALHYKVPIPAELQADAELLELLGDFFGNLGFRHVHPDIKDELIVCRPELRIQAALAERFAQVCKGLQGRKIPEQVLGAALKRLPWNHVAGQIATRLASTADNLSDISIGDTLLTILEKTPAPDISPGKLLQQADPHAILAGESAESVAAALRERFAEALPLILGEAGIGVVAPHAVALAESADVFTAVGRFSDAVHNPLLQRSLLRVLKKAIEAALND